MASSTRLARWNVITSRTHSGTSSMSFSLRRGRMTSAQAHAMRRQHLLLDAADREHEPLEGHLTGHRDAAAHRPSGEQADHRRRHRHDRLRGRPWARRPQARGCGMLCRRRLGSMPSAAGVRTARTTARSAPTPSSHRRAGRSASSFPSPGSVGRLDEEDVASGAGDRKPGGDTRRQRCAQRPRCRTSACRGALAPAPV